MIKAKKIWWADKVFKVYIYRLIKNHFANLAHFESFAEIDPNLPTLVVPNHNTWWDGFFFYFLNKEIYHQNDFLMMLEHQLRKYPFFPRIGVYGVEPENPKAALRSLQYTIELMSLETKPRSMICIFPQGELQPWNPAKVEFKSGIEWLIKKYNRPLNLVPLAIRCELMELRTPEVFFSAPENYTINQQNFKGMQWLEKTCHKLFINLEQSIRENRPTNVLLRGRHSVQEKYDRVRGNS
jgi:hypothetical protein